MRLPDLGLPPRFELLRIAGSGGMGTVYQVRDRSSGELYALKVVNHADAESDRRFDREQRMLAQLASPNIVKYVDHGRLTDGRPWLAMEWLSGCDLGEYLRTRTMGIAECLRFGMKVAKALGEAHRVGVVHRDLKPRNVWLVERATSRPKLIDFGIALALHSTPITATGAVLGTLGYVSPEQLGGARGSDPRTDLYALGCLIYCCLTGRPPIFGDNLPELLAKIVRNETPRIEQARPEIPTAFADLIAQLLAKDLAQRPANADEVAKRFAALLENLEHEEGVHDKRDRAAPRMTYSERRLRTVLVGRTHHGVEGDAPTVDLRTAAAAPHSDIEAFAAQRNLLLERATTFFWLAAPHVASSVDEAQRLAQVALELQVEAPRYALALLTTLVDGDRPTPLGALVAALPAPPEPNAARAPRNEIWVDRDTEALLRGRFVLRPARQGALLLGESAVVETSDGVRGGPFVGRAAELALLRNALFHAHDGRAAQLVLVTAAPGIGKSRLCRELVAQTRLDAKPLSCWGSRLDPLDAGVPYAMVRSLAESATGVGHEDALSHEALRARLATVLPAAMHDKTAACLAAAFGLADATPSALPSSSPSDSPERRSNEVRAAWLEWIRAELARNPLVWILEDLHWADTASVHLVEATLDACRELPLFVVATTRPEASPSLQRVWRNLPIIEIRLAPLRTHEALQLLRAVSRDVTAPLPLERLVEESGGNPLFLEELARTDLRRDVLIPASLVGLLEARVADLVGDERLVLRAASVIGERFSLRALRFMLEGQAIDVGAILAQLARRELIVRVENGPEARDDEYAFRHALTREAAYATLVATDRVLAHRRVASFLADGGEPAAAVLALHWDRGERWDLAAEAYARAAELAFASNDRTLLLRFATDAMRCGLIGERLGELKLRLATSHRWHGDFAAARQQAKEVMALLVAGSSKWFTAVGELVDACSALGDYERIIELASELRLGDERPQTIEPQRLATVASLVNALLNGGQVVSAERLANELQRWCPEPEQLGGFIGGAILRAHGSLARHRGEFEKDHFAYAAAVRCFQQAGEVRSELGCRVAVGFSWMELGRFAEAEAELVQVRLQATAAALGSISTRVDHNLALIRAVQGDFEEAIALETSAVEAARQQNQPRLQAWSLVYLSFILQRCGDLPGSLAAAAQVASVTKAPPAAVAGGAAQQARVELALGHATAALSLSSAAFAILRTMRNVEEFGPLIRLAHIEALLAAGRRDEAARHSAEAHRMLLTWADAITQPAWRESFLRRDPITIELLELGRELGPDYVESP